MVPICNVARCRRTHNCAKIGRVVKIVHIYKDYTPVLGGIENCIQWFAESFAARGHDVSVLVTALDGCTSIKVENGVRIVRSARQIKAQSTPLSLQLPFHVWRETKHADVVHLHAPYPPGEFANHVFGRARRIILSWHSDVVKQQILLRLYGPVLRRVVTGADCIIAGSDAYARTSPWINSHLDKCSVVPYGVSTRRFFPDSSARQRLRNQFNIDGKFVLLSLGRLRYYKGLDDLIRALPALPPDCVALIGGVGPMMAGWQVLAHQLGVADRVIFAGEIANNDLAAFYNAGDCYAIPANSRAEAFGIAILEAMSCGLPVISTDVGTATSWVNQHERTGFVIAPHAQHALARAALRLRNEPGLRARMGSAARARVEAEFTETLMIERLAAVYERVVNLPGR